MPSGVTVRSAGPDTYTYNGAHTLLDLSGEYRVSKTLSVYANLRNVNDSPFGDGLTYGPQTPELAKRDGRVKYGSTWVFGVRGRF